MAKKLFKKGCSGNAAGRPIGAKNKVSLAMKEIVTEAFRKSGGATWLVEASKNPKLVPALISLYSKLLPSQVSLEMDKPIPILVIGVKDDGSANTGS